MEKDARGVKCNKDNRTLMWKGVRRLCRQFKTTRRLWAHTKKAKLCSSFLLLRLDINFFFSYTGEKKRKKNKPCLTSLFWPKQIGLLVLAKREEFIHEQGEWKVTRTIHLTDSPKTRLCILHWPQLLYIFPKRRFICCATEQETMW